MRGSLRLILAFLLCSTSIVLAQNTRLSLEISPAPTASGLVTVQPGGQIQFTAKAFEYTPNGQRQEAQITQLLWSVDPASFGTITSTGLFTAATQNSAPRGVVEATATVGSATLRGSVIVTLGQGASTHTFKGNVSSAAGPIADAYVSVMSAGVLPFIVNGKTDVLGNYSIPVPAGSYFVRAEAMGFIPEFHDNVLTQDKATTYVTDPAVPVIDNINFILGEGGRIKGKVWDATTNAAIEGAVVIAAPRGSNRPPANTAGFVARTDAQGNYEISGLSDDDYTVSAQATKYILQYYDGQTDATKADAVTITSSATITDVDFALNERQPDPVYNISGTVYDASNSPLEGAVVSAEMRGGPMLRWLQTRSLADGSYELEVPAGSFVVWAAKQGLLTEYYDNVTDASQATVLVLDVNNNAKTGIDFTLGEGGVITGVVRNANTGDPLQGVSVSAFGDGNNNPSGSSTNGSHAVTDASGAYRIAGLRTGAYYVRASKTGYAGEYYDNVTDLTLATKVSVTEGQTTSGIDFALDTFGGSISGVVRDANGAPIADAIIRAWANTRPSPNSVGSPYGYVRSAANGSYLIVGLPAADYAVRAEAKDFLPEYYDNAVDMANATHVTVANQAVTGIDFSLGKGGSISGRITDEDTGDPLAQAVVYVRSVNFRFERGARTDANGDYTVSGLAPDDYSVFAAAARHLGEYYDNKTSAATATQVTVTAQTAVTGIDLALATSPVAPRNFSGNVIARAGGTPQYTIVEAINPETGSSIVTATDANGAFDFQAWDNAVVRARALGYVGMYAGNTYNWKESRWEGFTGGGMTITLDALSETGMASVDGRVTDATSGDGLAGAWIYGMDAAGSVFFSVSGPDGNYLMANTTNGSLDVMVSQVMYETAAGQTSVTDARGNADIAAQRSGVTAIGDQPVLPSTVKLYQNYPNPFNPATTLRFDLPERAYVTLRVFTLLGKEVVTLASGIRDAGTHAVEFNAATLPSGLYFARLESGGSVQTRRMALMK